MNKNKIVFVTNNPHKIKEIKSAIDNQIDIIGLKDLAFDEPIEEPYETLEENARAKSLVVWKRFGYDCFADDTGLEVDALNGRPGVRSARYAGEDGNAENNIQKLLKELEGVENRAARFRTVISLFLNGNEYIFEGTAEGNILKEKQGAEGFGYDPVFQPDGYDLSFAEMPLAEKNKISHRGKAVKKLIDFLSKNL
ncbi:MAG: non-canonical purine NTP diphosphatase [Bacteroidota bacterium]